MRMIMMTVMAAATIAIASAPASAAGSYSAKLGSAAASKIDLAQYYGGGGYGGYCRRVCVHTDYYGHCTSYRRVCD
jgi:hypothetical protein